MTWMTIMTRSMTLARSTSTLARGRVVPVEVGKLALYLVDVVVREVVKVPHQDSCLETPRSMDL